MCKEQEKQDGKSYKYKTRKEFGAFVEDHIGSHAKFDYFKYI